MVQLIHLDRLWYMNDFHLQLKIKPITISKDVEVGIRCMYVEMSHVRDTIMMNVSPFVVLVHTLDWMDLMTSLSIKVKSIIFISTKIKQVVIYHMMYIHAHITCNWLDRLYMWYMTSS